MKSRKTNIAIIVFILVSTGFCESLGDNKTNGFQIYLPREIAIKGKIINLGQMSIMRGEESLVAKAGAVNLGMISMPGQKITIDRPMVLSRLVCSGIPASEITLIGAEKTTVRQRERIVTGTELIETTSAFLKNNLPKGCAEFKAIRTPKDLIIPDTGIDIKLSPRLIKGGQENRIKVQITAVANGIESGVREVDFGLKFNCRVPVALVDLGAGTVITPENVKIEKILSNSPEPADWHPPYGMVTKSRITAKTLLRDNLMGHARDRNVTVIKRNQAIRVVINLPGLWLSTTGQALQNGRIGDFIKVLVKITDTPREIWVKINENGTVEPVF